eukprot:2024507-Amphidinium_carterae.1
MCFVTFACADIAMLCLRVVMHYLTTWFTLDAIVLVIDWIYAIGLVVNVAAGTREAALSSLFRAPLVGELLNVNTAISYLNPQPRWLE